MDIILENFPPALEWLKKTGPKNTFSGSYSKNRTFFETSFCYRIWAEKDPETEERFLKVSCYVKPVGPGTGDKLGLAESRADFSEEGLKEIEVFLKEQAGKYHEQLQ